MIEKILSILLDEDKAKGIHYLFRYRKHVDFLKTIYTCLLYTSPSPRDGATSRMPSSA